jgi:hypothetical protein
MPSMNDTAANLPFLVQRLETILAANLVRALARRCTDSACCSSTVRRPCERRNGDPSRKKKRTSAASVPREVREAPVGW